MDLFNNRVFLPIEKIPKQWFNIKPYLPQKSYPLLLPNGVPATFDDMCHIFPVECVKQGGTEEEFVDIAKPIREAYVLNSRPTPLQRAYRLEKAIGVDSEKVKIFFKCEYMSPTGSHKANTAIPQAYYATLDKLKGLTTETGAGQWGSALAFAGNLFGLDVKVFMVRISYQQKPGRAVLMNSYGASIVPSPSNTTKCGKVYYDKDPNHPGSLGIAISEAVEACMTFPGYRYTLGSVVDFVCLHQTVIGIEAKEQMAIAKEYPDVVIGCIGGGSNFAGIAFPFLKDKLKGEKPELDVVAVEPAACPSITKGEYTWDYGDSAHMAPIVKMYTLGSSFIPPPVHAGGLRYHGKSPLVSMLNYHKKLRTVSMKQRKIIEAGLLFTKAEAVLPAPESCHAIAAAIDIAKEAQANNQKKTILFNLSGHGFFDTAAYKAYFDGKLEDYEYPAEAVKKSLADLPKIDESKFMK